MSDLPLCVGVEGTGESSSRELCDFPHWCQDLPEAGHVNWGQTCQGECSALSNKSCFSYESYDLENARIHGIGNAQM